MSKNLLILERSAVNLSTIKEDGKYILEGVFTEIGVKNNNNRIYDKSEVMPHLKALQEELKNNKLLGELDHPASFDISLKNVSHVIESLEYDNATDTIRGRIRLLNTSAGKEAMALVDAGIPLHISSRAAGSVDNNNRVKIKKMFTYDLVAKPGFSNAQLERVNESYGFAGSDTIAIYELPESNELITETKEIQNKTNEMNNQKFITEESFNEYSKYMKEEFEKFKTTLENSTKNESAEEITDLKNQISVLSETITSLTSHNDYIIDGLNNVKSYVEYIKENTQNGINYSEKVAESVDKVIDYVKLVAEKTDQSISYTEGLTESLNQRFAYQNYMNENIDNIISHNNHIIEGANKLFDYQNYIAEHLDNSISHSDYIIEGVQAVKAYGEYLKENLENSMSYQQMVVERINEGILLEGKSNNNEDVIVKESADYKKSITSRLDALIADAKEKAKVNESKDFTKMLSESSLSIYNELGDDKKAEVSKVFESAKIYSPAQADQLLLDTLKEKVNENVTLNWLVNMPAKFVPSWNSLNENQKQSIKAQASIRSLDTEYKILNFWETRDLREVKVDTVNESVHVLNETIESSKYENDEYVQRVAAEMKRRFNR